MSIIDEIIIIVKYTVRFLVRGLIPFVCFALVVLALIANIMKMNGVLDCSLGMRIIIMFGALYFILMDIVIPVLKLLKSNMYENNEESE